MNRSEINRSILIMKRVLEENSFLPPFANISLEKFEFQCSIMSCHYQSMQPYLDLYAK